MDDYPDINTQLAKIASGPVRQSLLQAARTRPSAEDATANAARLVEGMIARPVRLNKEPSGRGSKLGAR